MSDEVTYSIVIPAFNESSLIEQTYKRVNSVMESTRENYELIFINDGSIDNTPLILKDICKKDKHVKLISFSRNFGHQIAITAGMDHSSGRAVIIIDADLQDPPEVMLKMIEKWKEGYDIVYGVRAKRKGESFFKKFTAFCFYRILKALTNIDIPVDTGDFRLIDRKVCDTMKKIKEKNRYIRGLMAWIGFKQIGIEYTRDPRLSGETKYTLKKMLKLAIDGITSFSTVPLKLPLYLGSILLVISFPYLIFEIIREYNLGIILAIILLIFSFNFIIMGIFGEYIGRIYDEIKYRPIYIISEKVGFNNKNER